jgi:hypothetical protein
MKMKFYAMIDGKRELYGFPPINTYFAEGFYPETAPAGAAFVRTHIGLHPLYTIQGERYTRPEYAGQSIKEMKSFKP